MIRRIDCPHWSACGVAGGGCCAAGKFGGRPSLHVCAAVCRQGRLVETSEGLGDTVAKAAHAVGADRVAKAFERTTGKPCGCEGRRALLNRAVPYASAGRPESGS